MQALFKENMSDWKTELIKRFSPTLKNKGVEISDQVRDRLNKNFKGEVLYNEDMSQHTSIRIGGKADVYLKPGSIEDIKIAVTLAKENEIPYLFFGSGSNTLVRDGGISGFVIHVGSQLKKYEIVKEGDDFIDILSDAGASINAVVNLCAEKGLTGIEGLVGIPGSIGGAVFMNAGARGYEIKDVVREITVLNPEGEIEILSREKLEFSYRKLKLSKNYAILSALLRFKKDNQVEVSQKISEFKKKRVDTQPINYPNLGSVFRNPEPVKKEKVAPKAAQLIEECGLKGIRIGGARVSDKHANFIINEREAKAKDVEVLVRLIRDKVKEKTGVVLETEIKIVGNE